jgi:hypothetical protein
MTTDEVLKVLRPLADGCDPINGEVFGADSCYNQPGVIRALGSAVKIMEKVAQVQARQRSLPANAGKPWTSQEDQQVAKCFDAGQSVQQIALALLRTPGSIAARAVQLGLADDRLSLLLAARKVPLKAEAATGSAQSVGAAKPLQRTGGQGLNGHATA